ncbi:hypothetical protein CBS101457_003510 [Exobasidium rhododendri]|nr:hypothetical protein CBS101457_003510 [Exobasidium rhododendri]
MPSDFPRLPLLPASTSTPTHPIVRIGSFLSRFVLHKWCASIQVKGLDKFVHIIRDEERKKSGRGVLTYANHISVADEPIVFGSLPKDLFRQTSTTRWTLGATDILFTNSLFSYLFSKGQVLPTDRGRGVFQPSLDRGIDLLEKGHWVHIFPEGYVNLSRKAHLRRFKWGVGRMLTEASREPSARPVIVPMWITGLDSMMPEPRSYPRWFPRPGANVTITFGDAINKAIDPLLDRLSTFVSQDGQKGRTELAEPDLAGLEQLSSRYPSPSVESFPPTTPLMKPPGGVAWPDAMPESRSAIAIHNHLDSTNARVARSIVAAELRAHLAQLGESQGGDLRLAHRLMKDEADGKEEVDRD